MDFVCNPAVGHHENLILDDDDDDEMFLARIALGYDEEEEDHVLVRLAYTEKDAVNRSYKLRCRMRFVREGRWFPRPTPPPRPVASATPAYADGKIYWLVDPGLASLPPETKTSCELVALDYRDAAACRYEVVHGPPRCRAAAGGGRVSLVALRGALCVACSDRDADTIDVWAMNNNGGEEAMEYRLEPNYSPEYSSEKIDRTNGLIWLTTWQSLGHYDPKTGDLVTVYRVSGENRDTKFYAVMCQESLVRYMFESKYYIEEEL